MASTQTVASVDPKYYVWWFPGSPVKVHLDLQLVKRLQQRILAPGAGPAEGGLLFGGAKDGCSEILDFQSIPFAGVAGAVAALTPERKNSLIGYYRSEPSGSFHLDARDLSLVEQCFSSSHHVFLMVHPNGFGPPTATFFFHDVDGRMADFAFLEFPFDPSLLALEEQDRLRRSRQLAIEPVALAPISAAEQTPAGTPPRRRGLVLKAAAWTCSVASVFALIMALRTGFNLERISGMWHAISNTPPKAESRISVSPSTPHPSMALHAIRQNGDLELTWNRESPVIAAATSGVISIHDGNAQRQVPLDSAQLRGGSLLYSPTSDQILLQLSVTTSSEIVSETVTVILPKVGEARTYPQTPVRSTAGAALPTPPTPDSSPLVKAEKPFVTSSVGKGAPPATSPALQEPPVQGPISAAPIALPGILASVPPIVSPAQPGPPGSRPAPPSQELAPNTVKYQPPVPVFKVAPSFPPELRNLAVNNTMVEVNVNIDTAGKVTKAVAVPQKNVSGFLLSAAAKAAQLWRFQPAKRGGEPVPSELTVQFYFGH